GSQARVQLGSGILMTDVQATRDPDNNNDLLLTIKGSTDSLRVQYYFLVPPQYRPQIDFADGSSWDGAAIDREVTASNDIVGTPLNGPDQVTLNGGPGDDLIAGGFGGDFLYGGAGNDTLFGMGDADTFFFGRGDGQDVVITGPRDDGARVQLGT